MCNPIEYRRSGNAAIITIDRTTRRNAIDAATAIQLRDAWRRFEADDESHVAVLTGSSGHFSAGADLKSFDLTDLPEGYLGFTRMTISKPTIAAIEGYCVAGGLEMALWCDLRVCGKSAVFGCLERRYGVPLVDGGTQRLPRIVGLGRALDLILTGREIGSQEALDIGLVNRVVDDGAALAEALEMAGTIGAFPQETVRSDREAVHAGIGLPLEEGLEIERLTGNTVLGTAAEGAQRFRQGS